MRSSAGPVLLIVGTRPEGIKMAPVYYALKRAGFTTQLCATLQHDELLTDVLDLFHIVPDYNLQVMRLGQDLFYLTQAILQKTKELFTRVKPSLVVVQGDTTSAMGAALAAFYLKIPVAHIEAGLRTDSIESPFPEEMNRRFIGMLARYHFAPTPTAVAALRAEGAARDAVFCVGNTVVDALRIVCEHLADGKLVPRSDLIDRVERCQQAGMKIMILTLHRRESFGGGITRVLTAVVEFLKAHPDVFCFYPFHPNPSVIQAMQDVGLAALPNCYVSEPVVYKDMVYLLQAADWVVTDSGGIQEEAVSLGKRVIIVRENTERPEGIWAGLAQLVGTDEKQVAVALAACVAQQSQQACAQTTMVYGDGYSADTIARIMRSFVFDSSVLAQADTTNVVVPAVSMLGEKIMKKLCVIGLGYIGLPTALIAAEHGLQVIGVDIDAARVATIMSGNPVIDEPELFERLQVALQTGSFTATTEHQQADYYIIAVPTPIQDDTTADVSFVFAAAQALVPVLHAGATVILESTVPVGTTQKLAAYLHEKTGLVLGKELFVAHCPERVLPGNIVRELVDNARIVGGVDRASVDAAKQMYKMFVRGSLYLTDATTAEMVKLVENSSRDVQLAFAHQVASMAYTIGLNPYEVIELANKHPRVNILRPTCGVGGHCIAVDPWFLVHSFPKDSGLIRAARETNDAKPDEVVARIQHEVTHWFEQHGTQPTVLLLGATYKPDVNDVRESPALRIAQTLSKATNMRLLVCEPHLNKSTLANYVGDCVTQFTQGVQDADIIVYLVAHKRFATAPVELLQRKKVLDFCGILHVNRPDTDEQERLFWPASKSDHTELAGQAVQRVGKEQVP